MKPAHPYYLAGRPVHANRDLPVRDKATGRIATHVALADAAAIEQAIASAHAARDAMAAFPPHARQRVLATCADRFEREAESLAQVVCTEAGKPIRDARAEVARLVETFRIAAGEATRIDGDVPELAISPRADGYRGMVRRVPVGACAFITPFNFPLNLVAHKVAPAIAAGCPFVLKPADKTPLGALLIGEVLAECDLPKGAWSILPARVEDAAALVEDERLRLLSFTGSDRVGWALKAKAGRKKVVLELGGNAACVVDETMAGELDAVVARLVAGAYAQAGQSCISVQRVFVASEVYDDFAVRLTKQVESLKVGDPMDPTVDVGPVIQRKEVDRIAEWVKEAVSQGAEVLTGGEGDGPFFQPTLVSDVKPEMKVCREEVFGPVVTISPYQTFEEALALVNDSKFGLQAGVFTNDINRAFEAHRTIEVGGVIVNDVSAFRADQMPYGGSKDSGFGREGLRFAMEEMTEPRIMVLSHVPL